MDKDILLWEETLFRNREVLELEYVPEHFAHRQSQMNALKFCVRPALHGARPVNALCLGPPGTGKTTAVQKLFEEIAVHSSSVVTTHINCQMDYTRYGVFYQIYRSLFGHSPPSSGISFKRIFEKVMHGAVEEDKVLLVALDDFNYLFAEKEVDSVLYSLLRAHETCPGARVGVIAILSEPALRYVFDPRVSSVFQPEEVAFPLYSRNEIRDILNRRVQLGFFPGVVSHEVLEMVVDSAERSGDLRVGIDLLRRSGLAAERRAARSISCEDVSSSLERSRLVHLAYALRSLKADEVLVLRLAAERESSRAGDLYSAFQQASGAGYTRFHEILNKLDAIRLIDTDFTGAGSRGRSRVIKVRYDPQEIFSRTS
ncbi:MAG: ORC1-type DNA replication protein 2 [Methanosaeta sp. PtaB.Bin039]|nr:MAG: ORC1-type DNA replication protein 2 [Methanosaeta sp. PtaB.Bin039]HOT07966.1 ORC1-type DNA replication protein [Methanotrichaceae archaeon]HQF17722.1 ORC1-type DNA replication protein [Methanotrichaceae archaeon]HQI92337.1 ORC1-type DNA replication protein [Methanotrichaceae archaeon]HQJ29420.1 ORC1-type DNA replication protein [Methanotrichaceae archaeon]